MTNRQHTVLSIGALTFGAGLIARAVRARRAMDFHGKSVVITGGSRGLGLLMARQLAEEGARITLAARDESELERARQELAQNGADVAIERCDIGRRDDAARLVESVVSRHGRIDVLINNAGIIQVGPLEHMQLEDFEQAMAVHFWGPLNAILAATPIMQQQRAGRIVNISSIGGKIGVPHLVPYCASKFALAGLSDSIRGELAKDGIYVTTVYPGLMRTGSPFNAWFKGRHRDEFTWFTISDSLPGATIAATRAAAQVVDACRHGDAELVVGWPAKLAVIANAIAPEAMALGMNLANRLLLPPPTDATGDQARSGWQSQSEWAPSLLTRLTEKAASAYNEVPQ